jgi:hypothetical protein
MPIILLPAKSLEANVFNEILEANRKVLEARHQLNISEIAQTEKTLSSLQDKGTPDEIAVQKAIIDRCELNLKHLDQQEKRLSEIEASVPSDLRVILIPQEASEEERRQFSEDVHLRLKSISDPEQKILFESVLLELERAKSFRYAAHIVIKKSEIKHLKGLSSILKIESGFSALLGKILGRVKNMQDSVISKKSGSKHLAFQKVGQKINVTEYPNTSFDVINLNLSGLSQQYRGLELNFEKKWGADVLRQFESYTSAFSAYNIDSSGKSRWLESQDKLIKLIKPGKMKEFLSDLRLAFPSQYNAYMAKLFIHQEKKNLSEYDNHGQLNIRMKYISPSSRK